MSVRILVGDCRERLRGMAAGSVQTCVTSPPYFGLRDYGHDGQIGLEATPEAFVAAMVEVFREVRRVLRDDGTLWLNLGDSYATSAGATDDRRGRSGNLSNGGVNGVAVPTQRSRAGEGLKAKDLIGIPWMVAFALRADGWFLRQDIIWSKPNPMPESVRDRCTKAHEYVFLLSKGPRYHYDAEAVALPASAAMVAQMAQGYDGEATKDYASGGAQDPSAAKKSIIAGKLRAAGNKTHKGVERHESGVEGELHRTKAGLLKMAGDVHPTVNRRSVWTVATQPFSEAHFATYPPALIEPCILAGCPAGGLVLDPFGGAGTTGLVADRLGRDAVLIELNPEYAEIARKRIAGDATLLTSVVVEAAPNPCSERTSSPEAEAAA